MAHLERAIHRRDRAVRDYYLHLERCHGRTYFVLMSLVIMRPQMAWTESRTAVDQILLRPPAPPGGQIRGMGNTNHQI
eukprot:305009-Prorocentrum_minimum.AAC.2